MTGSNGPLFERLAGLCREHTLDLLGVAPAAPSAHGEAFLDWIRRGRHGEMHYLAENVPRRLDPRQLVAGARSIVVVAQRYPRSPARDASAPRGWFAAYAQGRDYHKTLKKKLHAVADRLRAEAPEHTFQTCVDTAPLLEREHAARAGLGWIGKHTLLIHPRLGSYLLLGAIVSTRPMHTGHDHAPSDAPPALPEPDHCGACTRCIDACPTRCITPYQLDAARCISYLTIEHRGAIDPALHQPLGHWVGGCDVCQDVCPYNAPDRDPAAGRTPRPSDHALLRPPNADPELEGPIPAHGDGVELLRLLRLRDAESREMVRGGPLTRIKPAMLKRNAVIATGNWLESHGRHAPDTAALLRAELLRLATADDPSLATDAARHVLDRLQDAPAEGAQARPQPPPTSP